MAEKWTKTSSPPSTAMKPYPFSLLNHLTVPCATLRILTSLPPASAVPMAETAPYRTLGNRAHQTGRRDCTIRNRSATYAPSVSEAVAAGLAPVVWKSEKAADWLTNTPPVRLHDRCTPTSC